MSRTTELAAALAGRPRLLVDADLDVSVAGHDCSVTADGDEVTVAVAALGDAVGLLRAARSQERIRDLSTLATAVGLTVVVTVAGATVARAGRRADPGPLGRRFGVELRVGGLARALLAGLRS